MALPLQIWIKISQPLPLHDKFKKLKLNYICSIKNSLANLLKVLSVIDRENRAESKDEGWPIVFKLLPLDRYMARIRMAKFHG